MPRAFGKRQFNWSAIGAAIAVIVVIILIVLWATGIL